MKEDDTALRQYEEAYLAALALYDVLRTSGMIQVRRAELRLGEVKAEPVDFVCDVEARARDILEDGEELLKWWDVLEEPFRYPDLPKGMQYTLGKTFLEHDLGMEGHYRRLYFRVKNQIERRARKEADDARAEQQLFPGNWESTGCDIPYRLQTPGYAKAGGTDGEADTGTETHPCDAT